MSVWSGVLDSCPGLLCCVVNLKGKLLHATNGYKAVASRLLGHICDEGRSYPPMITALDRTLHELLTAACLGDTGAIELTERGKTWELTASPLKISGNIAGVVIRIMPSGEFEASRKPATIIRSDPEVLEAVPFRAGVVDSRGVFMAANKFLSSGININLVGRNITEIAQTSNPADIMHIIMKKSGSVECRIPELAEHENFYPFMYYDETLNEYQPEKETEPRLMVIHASPVKWHGTEAVMLTFEDITEITRTHDQLRRLLTFDSPTGILNRRGIEHVILREYSPSLRDNRHLSLIAVCLDGFRAVNESQGWEAGSRIIRKFVGIARKFLAEHARSAMGRWSGDEFMILAHCSGSAAVVLSGQIRENVKDIAVSSGVADLREGGYSSVNEFIGAAYDSMLKARRDGGNITVYAGKK